MDTPLFSVIIPTYNRAKTIGTTLEGIAMQHFKDFEVIIVDDGSTDNTREVVGPYLADARFSYYPKKNEERAVARNWGIERAKGKYITFLDSDDGYYPHCLAEVAQFLSQHPGAVFFHLGYEIKDEAGTVLYRTAHAEEQLNHKLLSGNFMSCINVFIKRNILSKDRFDETPALIGSEDYELWLRLSAKYPLLYHARICGYMLQHNLRSVVNIDRKKFNARMQTLLESVESNIAIREFYSSQELNVFHRHTLLYWSLHLAMAGYKKDAIQILVQVLSKSPALLASRKFLGIMKTLLLK